MNGSIITTAPGISMRNAEWPNQVSFIFVPSDAGLKPGQVLSAGRGYSRFSCLGNMGKPRMPADLTIDQFAAMLPAKAVLIGVDLGTKTIGLALSDLTR